MKRKEPELPPKLVAYAKAWGVPFRTEGSFGPTYETEPAEESPYIFEDWESTHHRSDPGKTLLLCVELALLPP